MHPAKLHPSERHFGVCVTDAADNNEKTSAKCGRRSREEQKKNRPGECPNQSLLSSLLTFKRVEIETVVSRMTCNILCQRIHISEGLEPKITADTSIHWPNSKLSLFLGRAVDKISAYISLKGTYTIL